MMKNRTMRRQFARQQPLKQCSIYYLWVLLLATGVLALHGVNAYAAGNGDGNHVLHHEIEVSLQPLDHHLAVTDRITVSPSLIHNGTVEFLLHDGLVIDTPDKRIERISATSGRFQELAVHADVPLALYQLHVKNAQHSFAIKYHGVIHHPLDSNGGGTPGLISEQGVFLAHSSGWYPIFDDDELLTFSMTVKLPAGWSAVSQGMPVTKGKSQPREMNWTETHPQDDIYLVASQFHQHR
jgi:aminopeptidase N